MTNLEAEVDAGRTEALKGVSAWNVAAGGSAALESGVCDGEPGSTSLDGLPDVFLPSTGAYFRCAMHLRSS